MRTAAKDLSIEVRLVMEVDFIPEKNELISSFLQGHAWDFLIGSVHEIEGIQLEKEHQWSRQEGEEFWLRYFELLRGAVASGYFSLVSLPVRMRSKNPFIPPTLDEELERLALEAARFNLALELNGFDVLTYPNLVLRPARACVLHRTPISVGSDAHNPRQVAQAHPQTEAMLRESGITRVRIWKQRQAEEYEI